MSKPFIKDSRQVVKKATKITDDESLHLRLESLGLSHNNILNKTIITLSDGQKIYTPSKKVSPHCHQCLGANPEKTVGIPLFMKGEVFVVEGHYCSRNCAVRYVERQSSFKYRECLGLFELMKEDSPTMDSVLYKII
jgi:hypothetical protein